MLDLKTLPPLSLYIHIPWCIRKCPYCDFNSHQAGDAIPEEEYINALIRDLEQELPHVWQRTVQSIFIGGGTPSLISGEGMARLLSDVRARLPLSGDCEVTLEANPGAADAGRFADYREAGINRLSIGVQSLNDELLQKIGRVHDRQAAIEAVESAQRAGFDHINLDMMFGLPGQSEHGAASELREALALGTEHISYYQLTIEPNTAFHHAPPPLPDDEALWRVHQQGQGILAEHGYEQYEVSAYSKPGGRCRHNLNYWQFGDYLGIGAGAHGKVTLPAEGRIERHAKKRNPRDYLAEPGAGQRHDIPRDELGFEFMLNALRLTDGFETAMFSERTGLPITAVQKPLERAVELGLLEWGLHEIRPTQRGREYLNSVVEMFL